MNTILKSDLLSGNDVDNIVSKAMLKLIRKIYWIEIGMWVNNIERVPNS